MFLYLFIGLNIDMTFQKKEGIHSDSLGDFWKKIKQELEKIMEKEDLSE
jgi:hypothetical protein